MKSGGFQKMFGTVGARMAGTAAQTASGSIGRGARLWASHGGFALRLIAGFVLTRASVLGGVSPFGVAFVAAQGTPGHAVFAALGACLGYLPYDSGMRYIAVCVLTLTAHTVFGGMGHRFRPVFMPLTALLFSAVTGAVYWLGQNAALGAVDAVGLALLVTELLLTLACGVLFQSALAVTPKDAEVDPKRAGGIMALGACLLLALSGVTVGGILSPARMAAVCAVMMCARRGGAGAGAASGLGMGVVMDLGLGVPFYSMSYGSAGMLSGVFRKTGKLWPAVTFVCAGAVSALWALSGPHRLSVLLEAFVASVVFMLIPETAFPALNAALNPEHVKSAPSAGGGRAYGVARERLTLAAKAFEDVHDALESAFARHEETAATDDVEGVLDRVTKEVCGQCVRVSQCWDIYLPATCAAVRDAAKRCGERGRLDKNDLPGGFAARCIHVKQLLAACNRELAAMMYRRQFAARIREGRGVLRGQYAGFAGVLERQAEELAELPAPDVQAGRRLSRWLKAYKLTPEVSVCAMPGGRMRAELSGEGLTALLADKRKLAREASRALGWMVNEPEDADDMPPDKLVLWEAEPVLAVLGVAAHKRGGQPVSGDSGAYFKTDSGMLYVILADGMGSGPEAAIDSREAVKLLEGFLRAGLAPKSAMETMNTSLLLKGGHGALFVTLDLAAVDLMNGRVSFYKYGAAPTYVLRDGDVSRVCCRSLPGGLESGRGPDEFTQELADGQWVVMVSDGIADAYDDEWLTDAVAELDGDRGGGCSPRDAASMILSKAIKRGGACDDMTALVLKTKRRRTRP